MRINKTFSNISFWVFICLLICFYYWKAHQNKTNILKDNQFTLGEVISTNVDHRNFEWIKYKFVYQDSTFENDKILNTSLWRGRFFVNKKFTVIFSKSNPTLNQMLIFPKDFEMYKLQYPDSLKWVQKL